MSLKFHEVKYGKAPSAKDNPKKARPNPRPGPSAEERTKRKCLRWMRSLECPEATFKDKPHAWWTITIEGEGSYYFWGPKDKEDAEYMADYLFMLADFESGTRWSLTPGMGDRFGPAKPFEAWEREFKPGLEKEIEEADKERAAGTSGSSRANPWKASVRSTYGSLEELRAYDRNYGIVERLGYSSAKELWDDNPTIGGSVHPEDLRVMGRHERLPRKGSHLPPGRRNPEGPSLRKPVCPNCGQWQYPSDRGYLDCMNDCAYRGFAPKVRVVEIPSDRTEATSNTGEPDQDYDHAFFDAIVRQLAKAGFKGATHREFDKYQGVYLNVPGVDKFWATESFVRGKPVREPGVKWKKAELVDSKGDVYSASRGDYFLLPKDHVLEGYTLVLTDLKGKEDEIEEPRVSDLPDILHVQSGISFEKGSETFVGVFEAEDHDIGAEVLEKGGKVDASLLVRACREIKKGRVPKRVARENPRGAEETGRTGLTDYQEKEWLGAIRRYGKGILDKSLLTRGQKEELLRRAHGRKTPSSGPPTYYGYVHVHGESEVVDEIRGGLDRVAEGMGLEVSEKREASKLRIGETAEFPDSHQTLVVTRTR